MLHRTLWLIHGMPNITIQYTGHHRTHRKKYYLDQVSFLHDINWRSLKQPNKHMPHIAMIFFFSMISMKICVTADEDTNQGAPILSRGRHRYPFHFKLPDSALPCSFESKIGNVRYYIKVAVNIPYASTPSCVHYFTIIGPNIDCLDERFLVSGIYRPAQK